MTARFQTDYPSIWDNICNDPFVVSNPELKAELMDAIVSSYNNDSLDKDGREEIIRDLCDKHILKGNTISLSTGECLGRVQNRNALCYRISTILGISAHHAEAMIDEWLSDDDESYILEQIKHLCGPGNMCKTIMWSFRNPKNILNPFIGYNENKMPCLLGLKYTKPRYVYFVYFLNADITPHAPTFFDAAFYDAWKPGGMTKQIKKCDSDPLYKSQCGIKIDCDVSEGEDGFPEIVHGPVTFECLQIPFKEIRHG